jgi:exodeoxyribonuclease-3
MKIATWNVNSIRTRLDIVTDWLDRTEVDVLCLQETKVIDGDFPLEPFLDRGYRCKISGQKAYNGVAIISKHALTEVEIGFTPIVGAEKTQNFDDQKRVITALANGIRIINLYVPNGNSVGSEKYEYKLGWFEVLQAYVNTLAQRSREPICILGDFNIALEAKDIYKPKKDTDIMASPPEREALNQILAIGFQDLFRHFTDEAGHYSWWDYRRGGFPNNRGWRIDHIYGNSSLVDLAISCTIDKEPRSLEKPSDHAPIVLELE